MKKLIFVILVAMFTIGCEKNEEIYRLSPDHKLLRSKWYFEIKPIDKIIDEQFVGIWELEQKYIHHKWNTDTLIYDYHDTYYYFENNYYGMLEDRAIIKIDKEYFSWNFNSRTLTIDYKSGNLEVFDDITFNDIKGCNRKELIMKNDSYTLFLYLSIK